MELGCRHPAFRPGLREETTMTDDPFKQDNRDRHQVAGGEGYEVDYFARKHRITVERALDLIRKHGNDRGVLDAEAEKLKGKT
jgi:hypothetical protein